jgi:hypothetical protein
MHANIPPEESQNADEETITKLKEDLARKEYVLEEAMKKLKMSEDSLNEATNNLKRANDAVAEAMRHEFVKWLRERETMSRSNSCGGGTMLL